MIPLALAVAVVTIGAAIGYGRFRPPVVPGVAAVVETPTGMTVVSGEWPVYDGGAPTSFTVADAVVPIVGLYSQPDVVLAVRPTMDNPTWEGLPVVFLVLDRKGPWLQVRVSSRPNNLTAWVQAEQVALRTVPNRIVVDVSDRTVSVMHGDDELLKATVAVGRDTTPTPLGTFFVDGVVDNVNDNGAYGAFLVSVSGFSEVLKTFGGGIGQIALHGTNRPDLLGQPISNGCVRMSNEEVTKLAYMAPLGTPVQVVA